MILRALPVARARLRALTRAARGIAAVEFALMAPAYFILLFGALDVGHTLYMKSVLQGAIQKAARDPTLETAAGNNDTFGDAIDDAVREQLTPLNRTATITFKRRFYRTFTAAAAAQAEQFTDSASGTYANGICDNNEPFVDRNNNGKFDTDGGDSVNRAGARDNVVYTVTVEYPDLFPLRAFIGGTAKTKLEASTVLANQPYGDQAQDEPATVGHCS